MVTETGWGEFQINIKVFFQPETSERSISFTHALKLHHWGPEASGPQAIPGLSVQLPGPAPGAGTVDSTSARGSSVARSRADVAMTGARGGSRGLSETPMTSAMGTPLGTISGEPLSKGGESTAAPTPAREITPAATTPALASSNHNSNSNANTSEEAAVKEEEKPKPKPESEEQDAEGDEDAEGEEDEEDAEGELDLDGTPAGSTFGADKEQSSAITGRPEDATSAGNEDSINALPVHSWQYDEMVFIDPTQAFYDLLIAHPPTPLPAYSRRKTIPEGEGAIPGQDRGSAGVPLEFTLALEKGEAEKLEMTRRQVVEEMDKYRQRLIELEKEQSRLKDELGMM